MEGAAAPGSPGWLYRPGRSGGGVGVHLVGGPPVQRGVVVWLFVGIHGVMISV